MPDMGAVVLILVMLWLVLTLAYQYTPWQAAIGRLDSFKFIPSWAFFAPKPANSDNHVVVREIRRNGTLGPWTPICYFPNRSLFQLIWHPSKRPLKIVQDAAKSIRRTRRWSHSEGVVQCSLPYLLILHYALRRYSCGPDAVALQFAVVETSGREERRIWITFLSDFHKL